MPISTYTHLYTHLYTLIFLWPYDSSRTAIAPPVHNAACTSTFLRAPCAALRKSGTVHGQPGLSAAEQKAKASVVQAAWNMREGYRLARLWDQKCLTYDTATGSQWHLLEAHWSGDLAFAHAQAVLRRGNQHVQMPQLF